MFFDTIKNYKITSIPYTDFYKLALKHNYPVNTNPDIHHYFKWSKIKDKFFFHYEHFENEGLYEIFKNSIIYSNNITFLLRLKVQKPIIEVSFREIALFLIDISFYEVSCLGWEAISICGSYIFEFTDELDGLFISNFKLPNFDYKIKEKEISAFRGVSEYPPTSSGLQ